METKEQKHTPEPWGNYTHLILNDTTQSRFHGMYLLSEQDYEHARKCVNALQGIEDPEAYRLTADYIVPQVIEMGKYKTACEQINPDNPMAVPENLKKVFDYTIETLKSIRRHGLVENEGYEETVTRLGENIESLTKLTAK